jgi:lipopolysaccharide export system permease protein
VKILHRYVLKEHVGPLFFALTALTSLLLLQYIAKRFGELVGKGLPWSVIAEFLGLSVPLTVALSMPMAVLVSTLYAFSRLAAENEITAMKAGGVSLRHVLTPVLWAGAGLTLFMLAFNDQVLPRANHQLRTLQGDIGQKKPTFGLREQVINEVSPGKLYLRAGHLSKTSNKMREVTIYDLGDATRRRTIYADSGNMVMSPNRTDLQLTLYSGTVQDVPVATPDQLQRMYFDTELIRVKSVGNEFQKSKNDSFKGEREMSVCEMERNAAIAHQNLANARREFLKKLAEAKRRKVKLSKDVLNTRISDPITLRLGEAYCSLLAQLGVKSLGAQTPAPQGPTPQSPAPQSPTPQSPTPQSPTPQAPTPQSPTPQAPTPQAPTPQAPAPQVPAPQPAPPQAPLPQAPPTQTLPAPSPELQQEIKPPDTSRPAVVPRFKKAARPAVSPSKIPSPHPINAHGAPQLDSGAALAAELPAQMEGLRIRVDDARRGENAYEVEIQKKFALAAACFVFLLLGAPIALRFPRGGVGLTIGVSLVVFALYYVGLIAGESLARRGIVPPFLSMWGANIIFTALALWLLSRMGKEKTSGRGGDVSDLLDSIRSRLMPSRGRRAAAAPKPRPSPS